MLQGEVLQGGRRFEVCVFLCGKEAEYDREVINQPSFNFTWN